MTLFVPLDERQSLPTTPSFLKESKDSKVQLGNIIKAITKARRIVVLSGAGISTQAGIPDFRSSDGLFQSLKKENPKELLSSGRDLFDVSVFNSEHKTLLFYQMIARLSVISSSAEPTSFHRVLKSLDDCGKLLRVYTQNIDAIERKSGLTFGIPCPREKRSKSRSVPTSSKDQVLGSSSRDPSPSSETPRCIPLHGTLQKVHCQICTTSFPMDEHLDALSSGIAPRCPECVAMDATRQLVGKRARGVGRLRPSVVLYNESHRDGEGVGDIVHKDLLGSSKGKNRSGADLLLVVGTSLKVPGTKRMVREFAKAIRARTSTPSPSPSGEEDIPIKSIYVNFDFPLPTREWEGVFDTWIQGDVQDFAQMLQAAVDKGVRAKEAACDRKRKREENAAVEKQVGSQSPHKKPKKSPTTPRHETPPPPPEQQQQQLPSPCIFPEPAQWEYSPPTFYSSPCPTAYYTPPSTPTRSRPPPPPSPQLPRSGFTIRIPPRSSCPYTYSLPCTLPHSPPPPSSPFMKGEPPPTPDNSPPPRISNTSHIRSTRVNGSGFHS